MKKTILSSLFKWIFFIVLIYSTGVFSLFRPGFLIHTDFAQNANELYLRDVDAYSHFNFNGWSWSEFLGFPIGMFHYVLPYFIAFLFAKITGYATAIKLISILPSILSILLISIILKKTNKYLSIESIGFFDSLIFCTFLWFILNFQIWNLSQFGFGMAFCWTLFLLIRFLNLTSAPAQSSNSFEIFFLFIAVLLLIYFHPYFIVLGPLFLLSIGYMIPDGIKNIFKILIRNLFSVITGTITGIAITMPYWYNLLSTNSYSHDYLSFGSFSSSKIFRIFFPYVNTAYTDISELVSSYFAYPFSIALVIIQLLFIFFLVKRALSDFKHNKIALFTMSILLFLSAFFFLNLHIYLPFQIPFISKQFDTYRFILVFWFTIVTYSFPEFYSTYKRNYGIRTTFRFSSLLSLIYIGIMMYNVRAVTLDCTPPAFKNDFAELTNYINSKPDEQCRWYIQSTERNVRLTKSSYTADHVMALMPLLCHKKFIGGYCFGWVYPDQDLNTSMGNLILGEPVSYYQTTDICNELNRYHVKYLVLNNVLSVDFVNSDKRFKNIFSNKTFKVFAVRDSLAAKSTIIMPEINSDGSTFEINSKEAAMDTMTLSMDFHPYWKATTNESTKINTGMTADGLLYVYPVQNIHKIKLSYQNSNKTVSLVFWSALAVTISVFLFCIFKRRLVSNG